MTFPVKRSQVRLYYMLFNISKVRRKRIPMIHNVSLELGTHWKTDMAAQSGSRYSESKVSEMEGFPFPTLGKLSEESSGKEQGESNGVKTKKPCRACSDFKSWMRVQKKQAQVSGPFLCMLVLDCSIRIRPY